MGLRTFEDAQGNVWNVWDVHPTAVERRMNVDPDEHGDLTFADDPQPERRHRMQARFTLPNTLRAGWLAFQCEDDNRRLAPIPAAWESLSDEALCELLGRAQQTPPRVVSPRGDRSSRSPLP